MPDSPNIIGAFDELGEQSAIEGVHQYLKDIIDLDPTQITIEFDELPPNLTGNWHICVIPMGLTPNVPSSPGNMNVFDHSFNFDVALIRRVQDVPKDRVRKKFMTNSNALSVAMNEINLIIDGNYNLTGVINTILVTKYVSVPELAARIFIEPPRLVSPGQTRMAGSSIFKGSFGQDTAALVRRYRYSGLRRITTRADYPSGGPIS